MRAESQGPGEPASAGDVRRPGHARAGESSPESAEKRWDRRIWPILIAVGLALVILVNGIFIYIAVKGADKVVPSYITEER